MLVALSDIRESIMDMFRYCETMCYDLLKDNLQSRYACRPCLEVSRQPCMRHEQPFVV